jgi:hypothetical protein
MLKSDNSLSMVCVWQPSDRGGCFRYRGHQEASRSVIPRVRRALLRPAQALQPVHRRRIRVALTLFALVAIATTGESVRPATSSYGTVTASRPAVSSAAPSPASSPIADLDAARPHPIPGPMPAAVVHSAPRAHVAVKTNRSGNSSGTTGTSKSANPSGYGCAAALSYLRANAAPGFTLVCPGYALGRQAMTCVNHAPQCSNEKIIVIADPCPAAYMNEAHNSWVLTGKASGIDPYGDCH